MRPSTVIRILLIAFALVAVVAGYRVRTASNTLNTDRFELDRVLADIRTLSSAGYEGRLAGTRANERAAALVRERFSELGLRPAGVDGGYDQQFDALVPQFDDQPVFEVYGDGGRQVAAFEMYRDYRLVASGYGSGIEFSGELVLVGHNLYNVDPEELRDRIVVLESIRMAEDKVAYVVDHGGSGVFFVRDQGWSSVLRDDDQLAKSISTAGKHGARLAVGNLSGDAYRLLRQTVGTEDLFTRSRPFAVVPRASVRVDLGFPVVQTVNVLGSVPGRRGADRVLLIGAAIDGVGTAPSQRHFPGATDVAGLAVLLEIARIVTSEESLPYKSIVFAAWNVEQNQSGGSRFYVENPLYPLELTTIVHLGSLGGPESDVTRLTADSRLGGVVRSRMRLLATDAGLRVAEYDLGSSGTLNAFAEAGVPGVTITSGVPIGGSLEDVPARLHEAAVERSALALLTYLKHDVYRDRRADFLTPGDRIVLWSLAAIVLASLLVTTLYAGSPKLRVGRLAIETVYFHPIVELVRRVLYYVLPVGLALLLFVLLVHLPQNGTVATVNGETVTNYSGYLAVKHSLAFLKDFVHGRTTTAASGGDILRITIAATLRSLRLIASSLALALVFGLAAGVVSSRRRAGTATRQGSGTLILASVPDVAIVIAALLLYVAVSRRFPGLRESVRLTDFVLPLLTLTVLPTAYVSRMSFIALREESGKDYVRYARARGYSELQLYRYELMPAVVSTVLDAVPTLMTVILTNLIVVEYLFSYEGIVYYLLYFYRLPDAGSFVALSLTVAAVYLLFTSAANLASHLLNPMKRKRLS